MSMSDSLKGGSELVRELRITPDLLMIMCRRERFGRCTRLRVLEKLKTWFLMGGMEEGGARCV